MNAALLSSERMDWNTPEAILTIVRVLGGGRIGLDPCSNNTSEVGAEYPLLFGGLDASWTGRGLVYVNPPYGREIRDWTTKAKQEAARGAEIILLVPARVDTKWFQEDCVIADGICFWKGRLTFLGAPAPAPFPSAVIYWGKRSMYFRTLFERHGWTLTR